MLTSNFAQLVPNHTAELLVLDLDAHDKLCRLVTIHIPDFKACMRNTFYIITLVWLNTSYQSQSY